MDFVSVHISNFSDHQGERDGGASSSSGGKGGKKEAASSRRVDQRAHIPRERVAAMNPHERHKLFMRLYCRQDEQRRNKKEAGTHELPSASEEDVRRAVMHRMHRFIREDDDDEALSDWELRLVREYYDRLNKEYCVVKFQEHAMKGVGMRWRLPEEVISGKGHFICGNVSCDCVEALSSYEVPFSYVEDGVRKHTNVKARLCEVCGRKLFLSSSKRRGETSMPGSEVEDEEEKQTLRKKKKEGRKEERKERKERKEKKEKKTDKRKHKKRGKRKHKTKEDHQEEKDVIEECEGVQVHGKTPISIEDEDVDSLRDVKRRKVEEDGGHVNIWAQKREVAQKEEKDEFDDYFKDIFA
jgi:protein FRA10AC1